jgi:hypothetical protein
VKTQSKYSKENMFIFLHYQSIEKYEHPPIELPDDTPPFIQQDNGKLKLYVAGKPYI